MADDFTTRAQQLLAARLESVKRLGSLLDQKAKKEQELADLATGIDEAINACVEAGWKNDELAALGISVGKRRPKPAGRTSTPAGAPSPAADPHTPGL